MTTTSSFADSIAAAAPLQFISSKGVGPFGRWKDLCPRLKLWRMRGKKEKEEETETERDRGTKRNYNGPMTRHFSSNRTPAPATTHLEGLAAISSNPPAWCHFIGRWRAKIVNPRADDGGLSPFSSCMTLGFLYVGPVAFFSLGVLNHPNPLLGLSECCSLWRSTTLHDSAMYSSCPEVENTSRERSAASMTGDFFLTSSPSLL